ncbi:DUF1405 domain-containing protein [Halobacteriales archaeon SW_10_68_16]|nr:MAG: DUF1405 domain-containing protein [Halobacteriales archaeon SW_10_68_16]
MGRATPVPRSLARAYLLAEPNLVALLCINALAFLVGLRFYVADLGTVPTALWPLFADSPVAIFLAMLSLATLLPVVGDSFDALPASRPAAYLHTLAFVWLLKMGLWTIVALNLGFGRYFPAPWDYFGIILTHLAFLAEAALIPHYGRTSRGALAFALILALANDALDYGMGLHPPLRYDPGLALPVASVGLSVLAVALAARSLPKLSESLY